MPFSYVSNLTIMSFIYICLVIVFSIISTVSYNFDCVTSHYDIEYNMDETILYFTKKINFTVQRENATCTFEGDGSSITNITILDENMELTGGSLLLESFEDFSLIDYNLKIDKIYQVVFNGNFTLYHRPDGFAIRLYWQSNLQSKNWYGLFKSDPLKCGKTFFCINYPNATAQISLAITHMASHTLICSGNFAGIQLAPKRDYIRSICQTRNPMHPKDFYMLLSNFGQEVFPNRIRIISPLDVNNAMPEAAIYLSQYVDRIMAEIPTPWNRLDLILVPNDGFREGYFTKNGCFLPKNLVIFPESPLLKDLVFKCIYNHLYKYQHLAHKSANWVIEGLIEFFILKHKTAVEDDEELLNHYSIVDGPEEELKSILHSNSGQRKKASGFFQMLNQIAPNFENELYWNILSNPSIITRNLEEILNRFTQHLIQMKLESINDFIYMISHWINDDGIPIINCYLSENKVCFTQDDGQKYIFPIKINFGPNLKNEDFLWIYPNERWCVEYQVPFIIKNSNVTAQVRGPFIINSGLYTIARIQYNYKNYIAWNIKLNTDPNSLKGFEKGRFINDLCYFVKVNREPLDTLLPFLTTFGQETSRRFWKTIEPCLEYLEMMFRCSTFYRRMKVFMAAIMETYVNLSFFREDHDPVSIKWGCFYKVPQCLKFAELEYRNVIKSYGITSFEESICAGMRMADNRTVKIILKTIGLPDAREPIFYLNILTCLEDPIALRRFLNSLFLVGDFQISPDLKTKLLIDMIKASGIGTAVVRDYLTDNAVTIVEDLGPNNLITILEILANYETDLAFLGSINQSLNISITFAKDLVNRLDVLSMKIGENYMWIQNNYQIITDFLYSTDVLKYVADIID